MRKFLGSFVAALILVGCGGGVDTDACESFTALEASVKPDGFNFDENNDGYMSVGEQFTRDQNDVIKRQVDGLREIYTDC